MFVYASLIDESNRTQPNPIESTHDVVEMLQWEQVGKLESELGVHDVVSIGNGQQSVAIPSEQEKLMESFTAQVGSNFSLCHGRIGYVTWYKEDGVGKDGRRYLLTVDYTLYNVRTVGRMMEEVDFSR